MDKLTHPLARYTSWLLIYLTAAQPLHPAIAAGITAVNGNTQVVMAPGNIPVVNIAPPNAAGISHNTYKDFNVDAPGAVLNNATQNGKSQLGVAVTGNTRLNGKPAELIINEVTSGNRSELKGKLEVFGNKAGVMIANPNGITCDGCGFINTPSVTLTTGKPQFDQKGALEALEVRKGAVIIGAKGLDGASTEYVDIISRATELNGKITAKTLTLTQGANRISYKDGTVKSITGEGIKPQLAVDTKALGGMYAGKIRLVATEDGVGVNLNNLTSTQRDISLTTAGKIQLGNTTASTELNIKATQLDITKGVTVKSGKDITAISTTLNNNGTLSAGKDMRLFNDNLTNTQAIIKANDNLWIQKDATGNKSVKLENRSGKIETVTGDLIIRTSLLDNIAEQINYTKTSTAANSKDINGWFGMIIDGSGRDSFVNIFSGEVQDRNLKWIGKLNFSQDPFANIEKNKFSIASGKESSISSGGHLYLNATTLNNGMSSLLAAKDLIATGITANVISYSSGQFNNYEKLLLKFEGNFLDEEIKPIPQGFNVDEYPMWGEVYVPLVRSGNHKSWDEKTYHSSKIQAGSSVVMDFTDTLNISDHIPDNISNLAEKIHLSSNSYSITGSNVVLKSKNITNQASIKSNGDLSILSEGGLKISGATLSAEKDISLFAINDIDANQNKMASKNISIVSKNGNASVHTDSVTRHFSENGSREYGALNASENLTLQSGKDLSVLGIEFGKNNNVEFNSGGNINVNNEGFVLEQQKIGSVLSGNEKQKLFNSDINRLGKLTSAGSITLNAGSAINISGSTINASNDISITAANDINLNPRPLSDFSGLYFTSARQNEIITGLTAGNKVVISAGKDIFAQSGNFSAQGSMSLLAGNSISLPATAYSIVDNQNINNKDDRHLGAYLYAGKNMTIASNGTLVVNGADISSNGDMNISSGGKMEFNSVTNHFYKERDKEYTESVTQQNTEIKSNGILTFISNGSILFQATSLIAKGAMDVAAKGGFLYAKAMEESNHFEKTTSKRKWYGQKETIRQISHNVTNKVTVFSADGDVNLLSRDDSTYEASKIEAKKNATLTSTHGKVNFLAVKNTSFEQTVSTSKGFFIKQADKGYSEGKWVLPSVYTGGKLTVNAASGISADVKVKNSQALLGAITALGTQPGTEWLKGLNTRSDVQWNTVKDAFDGWNYKSQSLNPAVAAVIAIAAAAVTAGTSLTATVATSVTSTVGGGVVTTGAVTAGMSSLAAQAAVALVENQGNLSKTLTALGSSSSVKSLVTSMAIGGALAGFDKVMNVDVPPAQAKLPALVRDEDWGKIVQRVAGHSVISSSLNTTINGGSFRDNLVNAMLTNIGNQINAAGAGLIGDNGEVLGLPGKALSHAVVSGISAEIGRGNGKGAAVGALAAELAGVLINDNLVKSQGWQEQQAQISRVVGAFAGLIATGEASGINSAANSAEIVERYNRQLHLEEIKAVNELANGDKNKLERLLASSCRKVNCTAQESLQSSDRIYYEALMRKYPSTYTEDSLLADYWVTKERKVAGNYPAFGGYETIRLFTYSNIDVLSDNESFVLNQWIKNVSSFTGWNTETIQDLGIAISVLDSLIKIGGGSKKIPTLLLPKPGNISIPKSGEGAAASFIINRSQFGKKIGKHAEDYGLNPSSSVDRQFLFDKINDIGFYPDKTIPGTFRGQGPNGVRGDVYFRIKGNDVVVTEKNGTFITIMKDGINNTSVQSALKGNPNG